MPVKVVETLIPSSRELEVIEGLEELALASSGGDEDQFEIRLVVLDRGNHELLSKMKLDFREELPVSLGKEGDPVYVR